MHPLPRLGWSLLALAALAAGCDPGSGRSTASTAAAVSSGSFVVAHTTPADGQVDAPVDASLYVTLSHDLDPASLVPGAVELRSDQGLVAASVRAVTPRVIEVDPATHLVSATPHLLQVTAALQDVQGRPLAAPVAVRFTTDAVVPIVGPGGSHPLAPALPGPYQAGVAALDMTPRTGVPLAGYGGGARRRLIPDINPFDDTTLLHASTGARDPVMAKCLVLANGFERVAIVTLDAVACDEQLVAKAWRKAQAQGFSVPLEKVLFAASHTHSGPGALTRRLAWQVIAVDLYRTRVAEALCDRIARAMLDAEASLAPAVVGLASTQVTGATANRRVGSSPNLTSADIDPELLVIRVDRPGGAPLATVWNFAIHGTHFLESNLEFSADIMGSASAKAEAQGAGVALFLNGAEGDIRPTGGYDATGQLLADAILLARRQATTRADGVLQTTHEHVDMGPTVVEFDAVRHGGALVGQSGILQGMAQLGLTLGTRVRLPDGWLERSFRYQAIRIDRSVIASLPGEPIHELGLAIKLLGKGQGYEHVLAAGLANGHGSYFTTAREYQVGGYEGLASMFDQGGGAVLVESARRQMERLKP